MQLSHSLVETTEWFKTGLDLWFLCRHVQWAILVVAGICSLGTVQGTNFVPDLLYLTFHHASEVD